MFLFPFSMMSVMFSVWTTFSATSWGVDKHINVKTESISMQAHLAWRLNMLTLGYVLGINKKTLRYTQKYKDMQSFQIMSLWYKENALHVCVCVFVEQLIFCNKINNNSAQVTGTERKKGSDPRNTQILHRIMYHTYSVYLTYVCLLNIIPTNCTFLTNNIYVVLLYSLHSPTCFGLNTPSAGTHNHKGKQGM
jgi:hypothetical protein